MAKEKPATDKIQLPLSKPIQAHGETISVLQFRPPTGEDILELGSPPFQIDGRERVHIDLAATGDYIVRLADVPMSSVKQMSPSDIMSAFGVVAGFFGDLGTIRKNSSEGTLN